MRYFIRSKKAHFIIDLIVFSLVSFSYPAFSFRGGWPNYVSIAIFGLAIIIFTIRAILSKRIFLLAPTISLALFLVSVIISTAVNIDSTLSTSVFLCTILAITFSLYITSEQDWLKRVALGFAIGLFTFTLYLLAVSGGSILHLNSAYFVNSNRVCNAYAIAIIFIVLYIFTRKAFKISTIVLLLLIASFFGLVVILGSRSALIVSIAAISLSVFYKLWRRHKIVLISLVAIVVAAVVIAFSTIKELRDMFQRFTDFFAFLFGTSNKDTSTNERFNMQLTALYHFLESPLFGHGIDGFKNVGPYGVYSHNTFTDLLCNFGIIGFVLYEFPLAYSIYKAAKTRDKQNKYILLLLIAYFLITQMTAVLFDDKLNALIYGTIFGVAIVSPSFSLQAKKEQTSVVQEKGELSKEDILEQKPLMTAKNDESTLIQSKANKSFKWNALAEIIAKIVVPISNMILSRAIAPEIFGIVASISVITGLADVFADGGFSYLILQRKIKDENDKKKFEGTITLVNLMITSILTVVIMILRNPLADLVGASGYGIYMLIAAIQIPFYGFSTIQLSICRREFKYDKILIVRLLSLFIQIGATIVLALIGRGIEALILRGVIGAVVQAILTPLICKAKPSFYFSKKYLKNMWAITLFFLVDALVIWANSSADTILINHFFDQTLVGVFKNAITMENSIMSLITAVYYPVLIALIGQSANNNTETSNNLMGYQKVISIILVPVGIGMFLYRDFISLLLFGSGWEGSSWVIGILGLANCLKTATGGFAIIAFYGTGKPIYAVISNAIGLLLKIAVYFIFGSFGFVPLILGLTIPLIGTSAFAMIACKKIFGIKINKYFMNLCIPFLASLPFIAVALLQQQLLQGIFGNVIGILFCIIIYFAICLKFYRKYIVYLFKIVAGKTINWAT